MDIDMNGTRSINPPLEVEWFSYLLFDEHNGLFPLEQACKRYNPYLIVDGEDTNFVKVTLNDRLEGTGLRAPRDPGIVNMEKVKQRESSMLFKDKMEEVEKYISTHHVFVDVDVDSSDDSYPTVKFAFSSPQFPTSREDLLLPDQCAGNREVSLAIYLNLIRFLENEVKEPEKSNSGAKRPKLPRILRREREERKLGLMELEYDSIIDHPVINHMELHYLLSGRKYDEKVTGRGSRALGYDSHRLDRRLSFDENSPDMYKNNAKVTAINNGVVLQNGGDRSHYWFNRTGEVQFVNCFRDIISHEALVDRNEETLASKFSAKTYKEVKSTLDKLQKRKDLFDVTFRLSYTGPLRPDI